MSISPATGELPLYLTMSRYARGSTALYDLRAKAFQEEVAAASGTEITGSTISPEAEGDATSQEDGFGFDDLLDIVNPLQHLPIVGTLYRELTGDDLSATSRIAGGALYGGALGAGLSVAEAAFEEISGDDVGGHLATLFGFAEEEPPAVQTAAAPEPVPVQPETAEARNADTPPAEPARVASADIPELSESALDLLLQSVGAEQPTSAHSDRARPSLSNTDFVSLMTDGLERAGNRDAEPTL